MVQQFNSTCQRVSNLEFHSLGNSMSYCLCSCPSCPYLLFPCRLLGLNNLCLATRAFTFVSTSAASRPLGGQPIAQFLPCILCCFCALGPLPQSCSVRGHQLQLACDRPMNSSGLLFQSFYTLCVRKLNVWAGCPCNNRSAPWHNVNSSWRYNCTCSCKQCVYNIYIYICNLLSASFGRWFNIPLFRSVNHINITSA